MSGAKVVIKMAVSASAAASNSGHGLTPKSNPNKKTKSVKVVPSSDCNSNAVQTNEILTASGFTTCDPEEKVKSGMIKLKTSDNKYLIVPIKIALMSTTIKQMITNVGNPDEKKNVTAATAATNKVARNTDTKSKNQSEGLNSKNLEDDYCPLSNVTSEVLEKVIQWAIHHENDPPSNYQELVEDERGIKIAELSEWDAHFFDLEQNVLFGIIMAANYLDMKELLYCGCKAVANLIEGKNADQIRSLFEIQNDFTSAELEQICKENSWCEEQ